MAKEKMTTKELIEYYEDYLKELRKREVEFAIRFAELNNKYLNKLLLGDLYNKE